MIKKKLRNLFLPRGMFLLRKRIISLRSLMIRDRRIRRYWKRLQRQKLISDIVEKSSWGISYSIFDGEELLENSIRSIRGQVNYINVVYQRHSWYGNPANPKLPNLLTRLQKLGLIDEIIEYIPQYQLAAGRQERIKRNIGLKYAKKRGVDYFMCMDADEFYIVDDVRIAKRCIIQNGITHSFCPVVAYASPVCRSLTPGGCFVQFFSRINFLSKLKYNKHNVAFVDPTRQLNHIPMAKYYVLPQLEMHHMTGYRKDMNKKLQNSSFCGVHGMSAEEYINAVGMNSVKVVDRFNILQINDTTGNA